MSLRIYNSMARAVQPFQPLVAGSVQMYVCGMTVYDYCHLGHARSMVAFDVVRKWLQASGYAVTFVRNITDIDDKIIRRAVENGESIRSLTDRMIAALHEDSVALGIAAPDHEPRATEYVGQMLGLIDKLEQAGYAYRSPEGDVNYSVRKFDGYGKLSGKSLDELRAGERVAVAQTKQDPLDFVLWKSAKPTEPVDAKWSSPYGDGRPGWHIECSAMSGALLGETFDIHGGGADLLFPHHENEIAQSEAACGKTMAQYWMHNGFVTRDNEKMSKSLGNFFTIRDVLAQYDAETVRFFIARAHYRSALAYSDVHLNDARTALRRLYTALASVPSLDSVNAATIDWSNPYAQRFRVAMDEDFGTPEAVAVLFELAGEVNKTASLELAIVLRQLGGILGVLQQEPEVFLRAGASVDAAYVQAQITLRQEAKAAKDYALADQIRKALLDKGIVLKDTPAGTTWEAVS
ncbi:cysteine--tRNA ligase [Curvibacter sp. CHRR-16]|uniref:cysteine--tRNA ligase n=1 Tax=Curvibacter sp. CHRR-16 TaxID=2835872 RepID=UPI001BDB170A|nr:cysteine--tRNA ligase [Curvibacter sp. CHRR-16]MBT0571102.1 cysteine--tRNA ligase [Curvibacter sp. CHRR-16]